MSTTPSSDLMMTDWLRALWLRERRTVIQSGSHVKKGRARSHARGTVRRWRRELSLGDQAEYERWLELNGWEDGLLRDSLQFRLRDADQLLERPAWLQMLEAAFGPESAWQDSDSPWGSVRLPAERRVFLALADPLVRHAVEQLREAVAGLGAGLPADPSTVHELFLPALASQLESCLGRTLTLELHVARLRGQLRGGTPEQRFESFATLLRDPEYVRGLLREYPVLARQLAECAAQWVAYTFEFLTHLTNDWVDIRETFAGGEDPGRLTAVAGGAGDAHRGGRSVQVVSFEAGLRLVYKPRPMDVDVHFHELIAWLNSRGFEPALRTPTILSRRGYGWSEFVASAECESPEEIERFYERQGGLLALLYAVEATDFHKENLVAAGEYPILVDLEALFHHRPPPPDIDTGSRALALERMHHSVLRVGLLPERRGGDSPMAKLDVSGLGGEDGQLSPFPVFQIEDAGTDHMRVVRRHVPLSGGRNRPMLNGKSVNAYEYREAIVRGFSRAHALVRRHRHELVAKGGLLDRFAEDEVRVVLRATRVYGRVRMEASHPSLLRDAADHDCLLYRLGRAGVRRPYLQQVLQHEIADLQDGSIPIFTSRPASRDLWTSRGVRVANFFERPSLENARERIMSLDDGDLARQVWFIRASLATISVVPHEGDRSASPPHETHHANEDAGDPAMLVRVAASIGDRLHEMAFRDAGGVSWVGIELRGDHWTLQPVGSDLYSGTAGIALFLAYLGCITGEARHTELALELAAQASQDLARDSTDAGFAHIGAFSGWSGWMYTLVHLAHLSGDRSHLATAHAIRTRVAAKIDGDQDLDVISGAAGLLAALAALHAADPAPAIVGDIVLCADHLVARAMPAKGGMAWKTPMPTKAPLTGFSHGASGIAWALLKAAALTGERRYVEVAQAAMAYERAVFLPELGNWPDYREPPSGTAATMWCHGAPGIGLARLYALDNLDDAMLRADLECALETTRSGGFGHNHCLCHGDLGNVQLLHDAGRILGRADLEERAVRIGDRTARTILQAGPVCGTPAGIEVPGLMCGIAGIGLGLLRLAHPDRVPSVLTLDAPPAIRRSVVDAPVGSADRSRRSPASRRKKVVARR